MQGCLTKLRILFHCLLDGGQFSLSQSWAYKKRLRGKIPRKRIKRENKLYCNNFRRVRRNILVRGPGFF